MESGVCQKQLRSVKSPQAGTDTGTDADADTDTDADAGTATATDADTGTDTPFGGRCLPVSPRQMHTRAQ